MAAHQKAAGGNEKFEKCLAEYFDVPGNFDDWHYLMQVMQARTVAAGVEWMRSRSPVCMGVLYWQLNDCWPVTSWAAVDGDGRRKPLWYSTRRFYADRLLTIQPEPMGELVLHAINDSDEEWRGEVTVERLDFRGGRKAGLAMELTVPARTRKRVGTLPPEVGVTTDAQGQCIVARAAGVEPALWFFERDKKLRYPAPEFEAELVSARLTIKAKVLLRDVAVFVDRIDPDAQVSDQFVTILPGESFTFAAHTRGTINREILTAPPVFQCVNRFGMKMAGR
jgi:beta-mannosidase